MTEAHSQLESENHPLDTVIFMTQSKSNDGLCGSIRILSLKNKQGDEVDANTIKSLV